MPQLLITPEDLAAVERRARDEFPAECCGLLLGRTIRDGTVRVDSVEPCVNQAPERHRRFTISAEALLAAYRAARDRDEQVVGTYHSHPRGAAVPSEIDRESAWHDASYLIIGLDGEGVRERRSWRLEEDEFVEAEMSVRVIEDEDGS